MEAELCGTSSRIPTVKAEVRYEYDSNSWFLCSYSSRIPAWPEPREGYGCGAPTLPPLGLLDKDNVITPTLTINNHFRDVVAMKLNLGHVTTS